MRVFFQKKVGSAGTRGPSKFMGKLVEGLRKAGVEVVFVQDSKCSVALSLPHWKWRSRLIPRIMRADGTMPGASDKRRRRYGKRLRQADFIIWQSEFCREYASKLFRVPAEGAVIYNGDDPQKYKVEPFPDDGKFHVLLASNWISAPKMRRRDPKKRHHGKYRPEKRLDAMLEIADVYTKKNPDVVFWVVGTTRKEPPKNPNIVLLGKVDNKTMIRYQVSANCMLHLGYFEWCPNVVVESLVAGTPVICVNGGAAELVRKGFGEVLDLDRVHDAEAYRRTRAIPSIDHEPVYAALDRWSRCTEKRPAEALFMEKTVERYIRAFEVIVRRARGK